MMMLMRTVTSFVPLVCRALCKECRMCTTTKLRQTSLHENIYFAGSFFTSSFSVNLTSAVTVSSKVPSLAGA